jgi:hypothetical protein
VKRQMPYRFIYILRVWRNGDVNGPAEWRFAVEDAGTGERHGFSNLTELAGFVESALRMDVLANGNSVGG